QLRFARDDRCNSRSIDCWQKGSIGGGPERERRDRSKDHGFHGLAPWAGDGPWGWAGALSSGHLLCCSTRVTVIASSQCKPRSPRRSRTRQLRRERTGRTAMSATPTYEVLALRYGIFDGRLQFQNYIIPDDHAAPDPLDFYVFAIRGNGRTIVMDTGFNPVS